MMYINSCCNLHLFFSYSIDTMLHLLRDNTCDAQVRARLTGHLVTTHIGELSDKIWDTLIILAIDVHVEVRAEALQGLVMYLSAAKDKCLSISIRLQEGLDVAIAAVKVFYYIYIHLQMTDCVYIIYIYIYIYIYI